MGEYKQFKQIKKDIGLVADNIVKKISEYNEEDLVCINKMIVNNYYNNYSPRLYKRHRFGGFDRIILKRNNYLSKINHEGTAIITVGSTNMEEHYNTDANVVFDLMWYKGIRGLPKQGLEPLEDDFEYRINGRLVNWGYSGRVWTNPNWNQEKYKNIFKTSVTLGSYSSSKDYVPNKLMQDYVLKWGKTRGKDICNFVENDMKEIYGDGIYYTSP